MKSNSAVNINKPQNALSNDQVYITKKKQPAEIHQKIISSQSVFQMQKKKKKLNYETELEEFMRKNIKLGSNLKSKHYDSGTLALPLFSQLVDVYK